VSVLGGGAAVVDVVAGGLAGFGATAVVVVVDRRPRRCASTVVSSMPACGCATTIVVVVASVVGGAAVVSGELVLGSLAGAFSVTIVAVLDGRRGRRRNAGRVLHRGVTGNCEQRRSNRNEQHAGCARSEGHVSHASARSVLSR
jgi:hypothetical protein